MLRETVRLQFLVFCLLVPALLHAQQKKPAATLPAATATTVQPATATPNAPIVIFARARRLSDLEAAGVPFHLKATYVATGDAEFTGNGMIEEWWQSKNLWRKEATLGSFKWVQIEDNGKPTLYTSSDYIPLRLRQAVEAVPMSFPSAASAESDWQIKHRKVGGISFTLLTKPNQDLTPSKRMQPIEAYYFSPEGALVVRQSGDVLFLHNDFQPFQNLVFPRKIDVASGRNQLVAISIGTLEILKPDGAAISAVPSLPENLGIVDPHKAGVKPGRLIHHPFVDYPAQAKWQGTQGTVIINATVDKSGKVREPYVAVSAGQALDDAALKAVRKYKYDPTIINGKPVMVDKKILFNFTLRQ